MTHRKAEAVRFTTVTSLSQFVIKPLDILQGQGDKTWPWNYFFVTWNSREKAWHGRLEK